MTTGPCSQHIVSYIFKECFNIQIDLLYNILYNCIGKNVILLIKYGDNIMQDLIKKIRSYMNMNQTEFAEQLNVTFATVNRWENGV